MSSNTKSFEFQKGPSTASTPKPKAKVEAETLPIAVMGEDDAKASDKTEPEKVKYSEDELMVIFDELLFSGEYTESVVLKGKLNIAFRTRTSEEVEAITKKLDVLGANLYQTVEQKRSLLNLQYSLVQYQGTDLTAVKSEEKEQFIKKLPGMMIYMLVDALGKFDDKVFQACKEGEENF